MKIIPPAFITFTGADDKTDIGEMIKLSADYPVEFGILLSEKKHGEPHYPSLGWIRKLCAANAVTAGRPLTLSAHLCRGYAHSAIEFCRSGMDAPLAAHFDRAQLNIGGVVEAPDPTRAAKEWAQKVGIPVILQCRDQFPHDTRVQWLLDASGGRGIRPGAWPAPAAESLCGYAGGIGPGTVRMDVAVIGSAASNYWIDMETGVRNDQNEFDLSMCREVCEAVYGERTS